MSDQQPHHVSGEDMLRALIAQLQAALTTARAVLDSVAVKPEAPAPTHSTMGQAEDDDDGSISVP